ncbi:hypothetical protein CPT03_16980 [Pedobacter ginsengisoli]|uniref:Uncharacterized protein n=1 Tax=Pedobacter ginsengisoli TaxID=363852 RepID=A0A2D1U8V4_9SPHI|nr:hypothetical protein [Pedobacter ginsengisoli]ATP58039.1 hypothetical protein CPT03_16980 [Pedobacter ginsengisoli]
MTLKESKQARLPACVAGLNSVGTISFSKEGQLEIYGGDFDFSRKGYLTVNTIYNEPGFTLSGLQSTSYKISNNENSGTSSWYDVGAKAGVRLVP